MGTPNLNILQMLEPRPLLSHVLTWFFQLSKPKGLLIELLVYKCVAVTLCSTRLT